MPDCHSQDYQVSGGKKSKMCALEYKHMYAYAYGHACAGLHAPDTCPPTTHPFLMFIDKDFRIGRYLVSTGLSTSGIVVR